MTPAILVNKRPHLQVNTKQNIIEEHNEVKAEALQELQSPTNFTQSTLTQQSECDAIKQCAIPDLMPMHKSTSMTVTQQSTSTGGTPYDISYHDARYERLIVLNSVFC